MRVKGRRGGGASLHANASAPDGKRRCRRAAPKGRGELDSRSKTYNYSVVDSLSITLAALSDETRRAILERLKRGPATVNELAQPFRMSQQAVSKHVAFLERAGLIDKRREGRRHVCRLAPQPFRQVADWVEQYRIFWEDGLSRLEEFLNEIESEGGRS